MAMVEHTDVSAHHDALRAADQAFRTMSFARPFEASALSELSAAWADYLSAYDRLARGEAGTDDLRQVLELQREVLTLAHDTGAARSPEADANSPTDADDGWPMVTRPPTGPPVRRPAPHHVAWLAPAPPTNVEPVELYLWTTVAPEDLTGHGLATADLFLLARLAPARLATDQRSGFMLRLAVPPGVAVDLSARPDQLPDRLRRRLTEAPDTYLLPLAWLADVRATACYELDGSGGRAASTRLSDAPLTFCFRGADHGVPGLPTEVVRWPVRRSHEPAYLTLPDDPEWTSARLRAHPGWLPLSRRRPEVPRGYHLLRLDVAQDQAIDARATLAMLAGSGISASGLTVFTGVDLALPVREFGTATITQVQAARPDGGVAFVGRPLASALPIDPRAA